MTSVSPSGSPALQDKNAFRQRVTPLSMMIIIVSFVILMTVILITIVGLMRKRSIETEETVSGSANGGISINMPRSEHFFGQLQQEGLSLSFGDQILNAEAELQRGDFANAENRLRTLLLYYPESITAIRLLGITLYQTGAFAQSEIYFLKLEPLFPEDPILLNCIVMCQIQQRKIKEAEERMEKVLRLAPDLNTNDLNLAMIAWQKGEPAKALNHLNKAAAVLGSNLYPFFIRDALLKDMLQTPEGKKILSKVKKAYEENSERGPNE